MNGRYLLDTNIIIALFANEPQVLVQLQITDELFVTCITIGELYYGAYKSRHVAQNLARIADFVARNTILNITLVKQLSALL